MVSCYSSEVQKETLYSFVYCYGDTMKRGTRGVSYQTKHRQYTLNVSHLRKAKKTKLLLFQHAD